MVERGSRARARRDRLSALGRVLCGLAVAAGVLATALGILVLRTPESRVPVPVAVGEVYTAGERPPLVGPLVVYGRPQPGGPPALADLGCRVTPGGGPLTSADTGTEDRIVVAGRGLVPLAAYPGREGHSIACAGPAAVRAAPLHVMPGRSGRDLVPTAAFSVAAFLVPVGATGLLMLRPVRD
jgi:hypothetical protein